jgi:hypothetical protein
MTTPERKVSPAVWGVLVLAIAGVAGWIAFDRSGAEDAGARSAVIEEAAAVDPAVAQRRALEGEDAARGRVRIEEHGRLPVDIGELPAQGRLLVALDLGEEFRGTGDRTVRIISQYGDRLDTTASPIEGAASGVELEIDTAFLKAGRYMIEIDIEGPHPLKLRRYVLEVE